MSPRRIAAKSIQGNSLVVQAAGGLRSCSFDSSDFAFSEAPFAASAPAGEAPFVAAAPSVADVLEAGAAGAAEPAVVLGVADVEAAAGVAVAGAAASAETGAEAPAPSAAAAGAGVVEVAVSPAGEEFATVTFFSSADGTFASPGLAASAAGLPCGGAAPADLTSVGAAASAFASAAGGFPSGNSILG